MSKDSTLTVQVAEEIRAVMGRRQIRNRELARKLDVSDMWVGERLRGRRPIDLNDLELIAQALGVDVADLLPRRRGTTLQQPATRRPPNRPADMAARTARTRPPAGVGIPSQRAMIR